MSNLEMPALVRQIDEDQWTIAETEYERLNFAEGDVMLVHRTYSFLIDKTYVYTLQKTKAAVYQRSVHLVDGHCL